MASRRPVRVLIDDGCDVCGAIGRGVCWVPGGPALCWSCIEATVRVATIDLEYGTGGSKETAPAAQGAAAGAGGGAGAGVREGGDAYGQVYCGICVRALADCRCPTCDTVWPNPLTEPEARVFQRAWCAHDDDDGRAGAAWLAVENYRRRKG